MNDHDFLKKMMKAALLSGVFAEIQKIDTRTVAKELFDGTNARRQYLEHHPSIQTDVTDRDMLLLHIDMAIDAGDSELFMQLTSKLKEMEVLV